MDNPDVETLLHLVEYVLVSSCNFMFIEYEHECAGSAPRAQSSIKVCCCALVSMDLPAMDAGQTDRLKVIMARCFVSLRPGEEKHIMTHYGGDVQVSVTASIGHIA